MSTALAKTDHLGVVNDLTLSQVGQMFCKSGFFKDTTSEAQAIVKIMAGAENGFGPFTSMSGIHIIKGKPEASGDMTATAIKRSGKYNYRVQELTDERCVIEFFERSEFTNGKWESIGISTFTQEDAKRAATGNENYKKYPRNMLFNRAITNGQAWFCPDVYQSRVYSEGELPREEILPSQGMVIDTDVIQPQNVSQPKPQPSVDPMLVECDAIAVKANGSFRKAYEADRGKWQVRSLAEWAAYLLKVAALREKMTKVVIDGQTVFAEQPKNLTDFTGVVDILREAYKSGQYDGKTLTVEVFQEEIEQLAYLIATFQGIQIPEMVKLLMDNTQDPTELEQINAMAEDGAKLYALCQAKGLL